MKKETKKNILSGLWGVGELMEEDKNGRFMTTEERLDMPPIEEHIDFYYKEEDLKVSAHFSDIEFGTVAK